MTAAPTADPRRAYVLPGDAGLDVDADMLLVHLVVFDPSTQQVVVHLRDGFGWWAGPTGAIHAEAGGTVRIDVQMQIVLPDASADVFGRYVAALDRWHQTRTPLRMVGAPGRLGSLSEDRDLFLPVPRSWLLNAA